LSRFIILQNRSQPSKTVSQTVLAFWTYSPVGRIYLKSFSSPLPGYKRQQPRNFRFWAGRFVPGRGVFFLTGTVQVVTIFSKSLATFSSPPLAGSAQYKTDPAISWVCFVLCVYCTKLAPISKTDDFARSACVVAWNCPVRSEKAPRTGEYASNPERKNTPCISDLAGVKFLLKKERVFFFRGSALQAFGQCVGLQCGRSFGKAIFWGKDLPKLQLICFWIWMSQMEKEGFGEEFSICSSFCLGGIRGGQKTENTNSILCLLHSTIFRPWSKGVHPRHPPRAFPLGLLAPRCLRVC